MKNKSVFQNLKNNQTEMVENIPKSVVRVVIFFEHLSNQLIEEIPTMTFVNVISNFGGMLGLFMGMSYLSFLEIFEIIYELILIVLINRKKSKKMNRSKSIKITTAPVASYL